MLFIFSGKNKIKIVYTLCCPYNDAESWIYVGDANITVHGHTRTSMPINKRASQHCCIALVSLRGLLVLIRLNEKRTNKRRRREIHHWSMAHKTHILSERFLFSCNVYSLQYNLFIHIIHFDIFDVRKIETFFEKIGWLWTESYCWQKNMRSESKLNAKTSSVPYLTWA